MASYVPSLFLRGLNQGNINVGADTFKVSLNTGTVPSANRDGVNQVYAGSDFTEATGTNYTAGGAAITLTEALYTTGGVHHSAVAAGASTTSWATVTLTSVTYAVVYDTTSSTKYGMVFDFGGAQSVTANTFTINWTDTTPANRIWYLSTT